MKVVAGLFDSDANATNAMDKLLRANIKDLDTHVIEAGQNTNPTGANTGGIPVIPNTGGTGSGMAGSGAIPMAGAIFGANDWLDDVDDETERAFYFEGMREGATLALARVHDEDVDKVRQLLSSHGARTYTKH